MMKEDKVVGLIGMKGGNRREQNNGRRTRGTEDGDASKRDGIGSD
jgi:hypothetical protein